MVAMTESLKQFLVRNYPEEYVLIGFGHIEKLTHDIWQEYIAWCDTEDGRQYLQGGSKYKDPS